MVHGRTGVVLGPAKGMLRMPAVALLLLPMLLLLQCGGAHQRQASEKIFPDDPNHNLAGGPVPIQQNQQPPATDHRYENGQLFSVTTPGRVTAVRFFTAAAEAGPHVAKLWLANGTKLIEATIPASEFNGTARWVQWPIGPVALSPGAQYLVSVSDGTEAGHHWAGCPSCWLPAGSNGRHITWPQASARFGLFSNSSDMPGTTPQFGQSYFRDVVFCASMESECGPLPPPPPPPLPHTIVIAGPRVIERPSIAAGTLLRRGNFRAEVFDQYGKALHIPLTWAVADAQGVSVTPSGGGDTATVSIDTDCAADVLVNVTATVGTIVASVRVQLALLKPSGLSITGPAAVNLATAAAAATTFTAVIRDQLGQPLALSAHNGVVRWSLAPAEQIDPEVLPKMGRPPPKGVSIAADTGVLTVTKSADRGDFSVVATLSLPGGGDGVGGSPRLKSAVFVAGDAFDAVAFLANDDTAMTLTVGGAGGAGSLRIRSLRHRTAGWEWLDDDGDRVPLPLPRGAAAQATAPLDSYWVFNHSAVNASAASFHFTAVDKQLELQSMWTARAGGGPVENSVIISAISGTAQAIFDSSMRSMSTKLMSPVHSVFHQFEKRGAGAPLPPIAVILRSGNSSSATGVNFSVPVGGPGRVAKEGQYMPLAFVDSGQNHGLYIGSEWELGRFDVSSRGGASYQRTTISVSPIGAADAAKDLPEDSVTIAKSSKDPDVPSAFSVPVIYYGLYSGDVDAGSNAFRRWFWETKIVRSLHDNEDEPWVESCWEPTTGSLFPYGQGTARASKSLYDAAAASGVELLKIDCCIYNDSAGRDWQFSKTDWPDGFDFSTKAHSAGLHTSLYLGGSYLDHNLSTVAGRDAELKAISQRFDEGWFEMWRTDKYDAPENPLPDTFAGVSNFLHILDNMITTRPKFRYENCANGGHFKGLALARRFTFVTTNDAGAGPTGMLNYRQTYWHNSHVLHPLHLKCDLQAGGHELNYVLRTCLLGSWLMAMGDGIFHSANYSQHIALYKTRQRPILRGGDVYHLLPFPDGKSFEATQFHNPALRKGSIVIFKPVATLPEALTLPLHGLRRDRSYQISFQDRHVLDTVVTGAVLMDLGLNITMMAGAEASEVVWLEQLQR